MSSSNAVVLDPGHGGVVAAGKSTPSGARGPSGLVEKDVVLDLARRVATHLRGGALLTRMGDVNLALAERCAVPRRYGAQVFVSIHAGGGGPGRRGSEAWVHPAAAPSSRQLAESLRRELAGFGGGAAAGPVLTGELAVLSPERLGPQVAGCLLEVDDLSDPHGEQRLRDPVARERLGAAIARGIQRFMGGGAAARRRLAEGQVAPAVVIGIIGLGLATFSLVNSLEQRSVGGLTWSRNITKSIHAYPEGKTPNPWSDRSPLLLEVDSIGGLSSAWALFTLNFRCNGNDIDQCVVEKSASSDWTISKLTVSFEGSDAQSYEENSVACIALYVSGTLDPSGAGDIDFSAHGLVRADGTFENQEFKITRGDPTEFKTGTRDPGYGWFIDKV